MATGRYASEGMAPPTVPRKVNLSPPQSSLDKAMAGTGQFTLIPDTGGTSHGEHDASVAKNKNSLTFLAEPGTMQVLAKHGVKFIAMEIRHEFQPLADKVANGEMDASQYAQAKADMYRAAGDEGGSSPSKRSVAEAAVIQAAAKYGIKILCVESQASSLKKPHA